MVNYEIVLEGKLNGQHKLYEFLFSEAGMLIRKSEIVPQKTDHLDY